MNNITTLLQRGNLTPKERYLLLIQNDVKKENTGKEVLTEADKEALLNWQAKTGKEAREWNIYNEGWKMNGRMTLEAEFEYRQTIADHYRMNFLNLELNFYPFRREERLLLKRLEKIKTVDSKEAERITEKQRRQKLADGMDFDYATYRLAFDSLSTEDKEQFVELYPDVKTDHQYLDEEEIITDLFDGKDELTTKAKEKLADLVAKRSYNSYSKEHQLFHYFACIPLAEVARRFLADKGVELKSKPLAQNQEVDEEDSATHDQIEKAAKHYSKDHDITIEAMLKEGCLKWLNEDLFEHYTPLVISGHYELLDRWLASKAKARKTLQKLIDTGKLKATGSDITGESLYGLEAEYEFVKEFKERVDRYDANLGIIYADDDPEHTGDHEDQELLLSNKNMYGELNIFSLFGMATAKLTAIHDATRFIKEEIQDGEIVLDFASEKLMIGFLQKRASLMDGYAKLMAYRNIQRRLSEMYEVDLATRINSQVAILGDYIDQHNDAIRTATGDELIDEDPEGSADDWFTKRKKVIRMKEDYYIDKDAIKPDLGIKKDYEGKFIGIFRDEY